MAILVIDGITCTKACYVARGHNCACTCGGLLHGQGAESPPEWVQLGFGSDFSSKPCPSLETRKPAAPTLDAAPDQPAPGEDRMPLIESAQHLFETLLPDALARHAEEARKVGASYAFHITGEGGGDWLVDLTTDPPIVRAAEVDAQANCSITVSAEDFARVLGDSSLMVPFYYFTSKLKVSGDPMLAAKLQKLLALVGK